MKNGARGPRKRGLRAPAGVTPRGDDLMELRDLIDTPEGAAWLAFIKQYRATEEADLASIERALAATTRWMTHRIALASFRKQMMQVGFREGWAAAQHTKPVRTAPSRLWQRLFSRGA